MTQAHLNITALMDQLESELKLAIIARKLQNPLMIGIYHGGAWVAEQLHSRLEINDPLGLMDISFYRDDFAKIGLHPPTESSQLPTQMEDRDIILIDDVFYTGRSSRAALNEIFDFGRPNQVVLGVLIERQGREIPLRPDCIGERIQLAEGQNIKLTGPSPLEIKIQSL